MKKIFLLSVIFLITLLFFNCPVDQEKKDDDGTNGGTTTDKLYAFGDTGPSGVGIVFYITDGGLHGLEASTNDQSILQVWIWGG